MIVFNFTMVAILMIVFNFTMVAILAQVCFLFAHPPHPLVCLSPFRLLHLDVGDWVPGGGPHPKPGFANRSRTSSAHVKMKRASDCNFPLLYLTLHPFHLYNIRRLLIVP